MHKKYIYWVFLLLLFISCNNPNLKIDDSVYEKAAKHLPQNLNKFVTNTIISQNWDNNVLYYKTKNDTVFKSFLIDTNELEIKEGELPSTNSPRRNYLEFTSPDGKKSIYIKDYNLCVKKRFD